MELKEVLMESVKRNVNVPGLCADLLDGAVEPALRSAVEKSSTKIDDVVLNALYPIFEEELKKGIADAWGKLLASEPKDGEPVAEEVHGEGPVL